MSEPAAPDPSPDPRPDGAAEPPPILGSWRNLYLVLVLELAVITALLFALSRWLA